MPVRTRTHATASVAGYEPDGSWFGGCEACAIVRITNRRGITVAKLMEYVDPLYRRDPYGRARHIYRSGYPSSTTTLSMCGEPSSATLTLSISSSVAPGQKSMAMASRPS
jgi:hypothetical protein